ncbi:MAG TPA: hypothetical protein VHR85_14630 [Nocardioides sp.]|nr:hypothetical protein [Nocardioides sp.]
MPESRGRARPSPLVVAASLTAVEGLLVLAYGVLLAADIHADRAAMGVTTSLFFILLGAALVACAWAVVHGHAWARSPLVVTQVLALGLAWNFLGGSTTWVSVVLAVIAVVVLVGLLHPASVEALSDRRDDAT